MTREELGLCLMEQGLGRLAEALPPLCERCVLVRTDAHPYDDFPIGTSRIGGLPDLPAKMEWPRWLGKPLSFLAQFNLDDLQDFACCRVLPSTGHLWFFYDGDQETWGLDPDDRDSWRVVYADEVPLSRRQENELPDHARYLPCKVAFHELLSIPGPESLSVAPLALTLEEIEEIEEIEADLHEKIEPRRQGRFEPHHQLLGHPKGIQGEMQRECQLVSHGIWRGRPFTYEEATITELEAGATDWRLLFQLDTDDDRAAGKPGMMWGDCGRLYFWIRNQDLATKSFENSWMVLQCS